MPLRCMSIVMVFNRMLNEMKKKAAKKLSELEKEETTINNFQLLSIDDLYKRKFSEDRWKIDSMVPHEGVTIISGAPGNYKTWIMLQMALSIAKGDLLFGQFQSRKGGVLLIDEENHLRLLKERMQLLGATDDLPIYFLSQEGFLVTSEKMIEKVLQFCEEKELDVIFIDSLVRVNKAEENDASQMAEVFRSITKLVKNNKTVVLSHHERKEGAYKSSAQTRLRGSSDIAAAVDSHISVRKDRNNDEKVIIEDGKLRQSKQREQFELQVESGNDYVKFNYLGVRDQEKEKRLIASEMIVQILAGYPDGLSKQEIIRQVVDSEKAGEKSTRRAIADLIRSGNIIEGKGAGNTKMCRLKDQVKVTND